MSPSSQDRYLVISHAVDGRPYRIVGSASKKKDETYFLFFLRLLPGIPFFIVPHRERSGEYLVFSGRSRSENGAFRFFCKIGSAVHLYQKNAIEIHLPDLKQVYYLKLDPTEPILSENQAVA